MVVTAERGTADKHLVIGAGFVGLGMAQALQAADIPYDQVDASDAIGGNWNHGVYATAHIISSKKVTQFTSYPMPDDYPHFPSAQQVLGYLNRFADHYDLGRHIQLGRKVIMVRPIEANQWEVTYDSGSSRVYKGVILCNGHHWCPRMPTFRGEFDGEIIHSKDYRHPSQLHGKNVVVIGGGNSACDIAAEAARVARTSVLSLRESVWFIPKSVGGVPLTNLVHAWMPEWLQRLIVHTIIRIVFGSHQSYGLNKPTHRLFSKHPTLNNEVPYYVMHGRITVKPAVKALDQNQVHFVDGSTAPADLIVCATGYQLAYPFLPQELQRIQGATVQCYAGSFLPDFKGLYYIGWGQARGGVGSLISAYAPLFARLLRLQDQLDIPLGLVFKQLGLSLPETHLSDPQAVFRQLRVLGWSFPWLQRRAMQIDRRHGPFENRPIEAIQPPDTMKVF